jgi:NodT family efflux transporter outer membrane factor (OMF) lipoprotein
MSVPRFLPSTLLLAVLAGCATPPDLGPRTALPEGQPLQAERSLKADAAVPAAWPQEAWWQRYGDAQLDALVQEALADAPTLQDADARVRAAAALAEQQGASLRPDVALNASATRQRQSYNNGIPAAFVPQGWNNYGRATLDLGFHLDLWGRDRAALAALTSQWEARQADAAMARVALSCNLVQAWADLARLYAQRDTAEAALRTRQQTTELMRGRQAQGLDTLAAVRQAESRQAQAEGQLQALDEQITLQRHQVAALMGQGPDRALDLPRPTLQLDHLQGLPSALPLNLLGRRPDIVSARLSAEAASRRIDVARAGFYPDINLSAYFGVQSLGLDLLDHASSHIGSIGPAISLPLFDQGRLKGSYRQAYADYDSAVARYRQSLSDALHEVADAATSAQALDGRLHQAHLASEAAQEAWTLVKRRYEGGLATYLDVLSAEDSYLALERDLTDLQARRLYLDVSLVRALGGGWQQASAS